MAEDNKLSRRQQLEKYIEGLQQGRAASELQAELGLTTAAFNQLKEAALGTEIDRLKSNTTEQTYIEYCLAQQGCIRDLNDLLDQYREAKNASAIVGAVKARSDIIDKMIKLGQDFGIIERKPQENRIIAGVVVTQLSNEELRAAITDQISSLNNLVTEYGDKKIQDMNPGELYREIDRSNVIEAKLEPTKSEPEPLQEVESGRQPAEPPAPHRALPPPPRQRDQTDKTNRSKANKVHKGRRVVKPPGR